MPETKPIYDLEILLRSLEPSLAEGEHVFCFIAKGGAIPPGLEPMGTFHEEEGLTMILERSEADRAGMAYGSVFARITLRVHSSLDAVGLTAAVAGALAKEGIAANMVAAFHHDHVFVPATLAQSAIAVLKNLQASSSQSGN